MSGYLIIGSAYIRSYRWDVPQTEIWRMDSRDPTYISPRYPPELHLDLGPIISPSQKALEALRTGTYTEVFLGIPQPSNLSKELSGLIATHGKDAVAVMLDSLLEKL